jgi:uncharacterized membrane protein
LKSSARPGIVNLAAYFVLAVLTIIMLLTIAQYSAFRDDIGFLQFKQQYLSNGIWKTAFYVHVFSCFVCLLAGFTQFIYPGLGRRKRLHRIFGRIYAYNILFINFPAGMVLAVFANGGLPSRLAFFLLDILWFYCTLKAITAARRGNIQKHREYMTRSYALTLSALTLRLWKQVFINFSSIDPATIYMIDAWMGFVPNLLVAEWLIRKKRSKLPLKRDTVYKDPEGKSYKHQETQQENKNAPEIGIPAGTYVLAEEPGDEIRNAGNDRQYR